MTIDTKIPIIDEQGGKEKVLSGYQIHTISIVGEGALGVNLTKVKSKSDNGFLQTEKGKKLMTKVKSAKLKEEELEAEIDAEVPEVEDVKVDESEIVEGDPIVEEDDVVADEAPVVEDSEVKVEDSTDVPVEVKDAKEDVADALVAEDTPAVDEDVEPEVAPIVVEDAPVDSPVEKAKSFTSEEMITAQTEILKGVHALVEKIKAAIPDADLWEITDMVYNSIWKVEDAIWSAENSLWNDVYNEVYTEVNTRVNKAKSLEVAKNGNLEEKLKSLEATDPELATIMKLQIAENAENKAKALAAEDETKRILRAKSLESGAIQFKRICTDENTTDQLVDALAAIEVSDAGSHAVIAKALETASNITLGGELFGNVGESGEAEIVSEADYVTSKAKALVDANGGEMAAARATVRQSEDYLAMFS